MSKPPPQRLASERAAEAEALISTGHVARVDLREADLSGRNPHQVDFEEVHLGRAKLSHWDVRSCRFMDVDFSGTDLNRWSDRGNVFSGCRFIGSSLKDAALGFEGSLFENCTFERIDFRRTSFARPEFDDCTFESCRFEGVDFFASSFERCVFRGPLVDAWFRGGYPLAQDEKKFGPARANRMLEVDLSRATPRWLTFSDGCDLSTCILPPDEEIVRFGAWPTVLRRARVIIDERFVGDAHRQAMEWIATLEIHAQRQDWYLVNFRDIGEDSRGVLGPAFREAFQDAARMSTS